MQERSALAEAVDFLRAALSGGEREIGDVKGEARRAGIADATLRRARERLCLKADRQGAPGTRQRFVWRLPPPDEAPGAGLPPQPDARRRGGEDMSKLRAVDPAEAQAAEPEAPPEFSEELPPLQVDPTSFDARMAGVESCSVVRELSKHWSRVAAFQVEQEQLRSRKAGEPPLDEVALRDRRGELWRAKWEARPDEE